MAAHIYGIDFGTSNSVLAALNTQTKEIVKISSDSSVIYFEDDSKIFFGKTAIQKYISNNMRGRLLKSVKTLLPQPNFTFTYIFGKKYTAEDLICLLLTHLKTQTDTVLGEDVKEVVLGRPVVFSEDAAKDKLAEKRLLNAARKAGFEKIWFQYEPIAAGFLYEQTIDNPEMVLIGDFGGGTSDFTLMQLDKEKMYSKNRRDDIIHTGGIHIGGDDFDAAIMWHQLVPYFGYGLQYHNYGKMLDLPVHIFRTLCEWEQMAFLKEGDIRRSLNEYYYATNNHSALQKLMVLIDQNLGFSLFQAIEKSKIELSSSPLSNIVFQHDIIDIEETVTLSQFHAHVFKDVEKMKNYVSEFLKNSGVSHDKIDHIFLTGGSSSLQIVLDIFRHQFRPEKIHNRDNFTSVAQGLALSYFYLRD